MLMRCLSFILVCVATTTQIFAQSNTNSDFVLARLKYHGGGDWYNDPSAIPNLLAFMRAHSNVPAGQNETVVEIMDDELFTFPFLFMTGHGRVQFSGEEAARLRNYLASGGFLYADDDYGMDESFRAEIAKIFPDAELREIPFTHEIYRNHFRFPNGVPKIHEHDGGPPQAFGLFYEGRMVLYYTFNTNISDGWADPNVHEDPEEIRKLALEMGTNIVVYALTH
jgi:hypothetical protein